MDMVWACFCFDNLHTLLLAQLPQDFSDIRPDLFVYYHSPIDISVQTQHGIDISMSYGRNDSCLFLHQRDLLIIVVAWSANHFYYHGELFLIYFTPRWKLFFCPRQSRGDVVRKRKERRRSRLSFVVFTRPGSQSAQPAHPQLPSHRCRPRSVSLWCPS